jgi:hypothetical protein
LVRGRTSCAGEEKIKRGRIIGEVSSMAQEGGAQQNYVPPFVEFRRCRVVTVVYQCKHGGVVQPCQHQICVAQRNLCGAICTSSSTTTKWPSLEDTLQEACKLLQPSKPMQTKWVKEMQASLMSFDTFT